ncbi:MAG: ornithine carbamoyltransferase, partial [Myxococcales bacterium]|nr:ornithine carbamoyltransferase [Myxococcales bacterium]
MAKRDLLRIDDLSRAELVALLDRAQALRTMRAEGGRVEPLRGKTLAMIFEKASTRTRVSFESGAFLLGGQAIMLRPDELQIGRGESMADTARVLSRYIDGIMIRTFSHQIIEDLAHYATVPVINGLTDLTHPCQVLADLQTCQMAFGAQALPTMTVAWIGDGNNMAHSWINAAKVLGFQLRLACPAGYDPDPSILAAAGDRAVLVRDPREAAEGAHVITTDVWASMGQEAEQAARVAAFKGFQVDEALMALGDGDAIFLHCLP